MVDLVRFLSQFWRNEALCPVHNLVDHNLVYFLVYNLVYRQKIMYIIGGGSYERRFCIWLCG